MNDESRAGKTAAPTYEQRKRALIAQGESYRRQIDASRTVLRDNLQADQLGRNAVSHITSAAYSAFDNLFSWSSLRNGNLQTLLPIAASAYSLLSKRRLLVPLLRGAAVAAAVSTAAVVLFRKNRQRRQAQAAPDGSAAQE